MAVNDFNKCIRVASGARQTKDMDLLEQIIPNAVSVVKTTLADDKRGFDYVLTLDDGHQIKVDAKTRRAGCSRYWKHGPELALETWSVYPNGNLKGKIGWCRSTKSPVDMILFTFDPKDCAWSYLLPFQHLRSAFEHNLKNWIDTYGERVQNSKAKGGRTWQSRALFVPASIVLAAITDRMVVGRG